MGNSRKYSKKYYQLNKERIRKRMKIYHKKNRMIRNKKANSIYYEKQKWMSSFKKSIGCSICGYNKCSHCLDFHHINDKYKKYPIDTYAIVKKDFFVELQKCMLLCCNCHREIHFKEKQYVK
jgi:hypothetical protein